MPATTISEKKRVLISGASIAGPALAYWLDRYGFHVTVVERADAIRSGGYPIDVRGIAIDVVERMGVLSQIRSAHLNLRYSSDLATSESVNIAFRSLHLLGSFMMPVGPIATIQSLFPMCLTAPLCPPSSPLLQRKGVTDGRLRNRYL
jgi:2-polyprenyl-6-methoxyphenol hydroxylase-like FAD-dependent oxidoreductase